MIRLILFLVVILLSWSTLQAQEETAATTTAIAPPPAVSGASGETPFGAPAEIRIGGLRKRIFSDRDSQRYRIDEESVYDALESSKEAGDITEDMSLVERARVIAIHLQTKPENAVAYSAMTKAKTPEERRAAVRELMTRVKAIIRILELLESSLPGL